MKIKKYIIRNLLFSVLIIAAILRLWNLGGNPPGLTSDEASLGYNAYSILKTGRDEYGKVLPIIFKSFGDYKPGLYVYLTVPFVAFFGLNEFAVRLPGAIAGIMAVWLVYLLVKKLLNVGLTAARFKKNTQNTQTRDSLSAITASFILAISPWHILFSRGAWEANVSLTLTLAGILLYLKSLEKSKYLIGSAVFFSLTLVSYQGAKLSTLIVLLILITVYWKEFIHIDRTTLAKSALAGVVLIIPIIVSLFTSRAGRLEVFSVFSYPRPVDYLQDFLNEGNEKVGDLTYYLFHSEALNFTRGIMGRWFNHFSGKFLFFEGDYQNPRHSPPYQGVLLLWEIFLLPFGFYKLTRKGLTKINKFILLWLILAPLPAVLTRDQVQAVRALNMVVPLVLIAGFGLSFLVSSITKFRKSTLMLSGYLLLFFAFVISFVYFLDAYFIHVPTHNAKYWFWGYKQAVNKVSSIEDKYNQIIVEQSYGQPYIYFLFYKKYDPVQYQKQAKLADGGKDVGLVAGFDKYSFVRFTWPYATGQEKVLLVGSSVAVPPEINLNSYNVVDEIKYPDGFITAFKLVETK
jgi:4-amino-4-deoxy-L-arabinose transferase-like glycosyltransferase